MFNFWELISSISDTETYLPNTTLAITGSGYVERKKEFYHNGAEKFDFKNLTVKACSNPISGNGEIVKCHETGTSTIIKTGNGEKKPCLWFEKNGVSRPLNVGHTYLSPDNLVFNPIQDNYYLSQQEIPIIGLSYLDAVFHDNEINWQSKHLFLGTHPVVCSHKPIAEGETESVLKLHISAEQPSRLDFAGLTNGEQNDIVRIWLSDCDMQLIKILAQHNGSAGSDWQYLLQEGMIIIVEMVAFGATTDMKMYIGNGS